MKLLGFNASFARTTAESVNRSYASKVIREQITEAMSGGNFETYVLTSLFEQYPEFIEELTSSGFKIGETTGIRKTRIGW